MTAADDPAAGFLRAARLFAERCAQRAPEPKESFLRAHADLREWLEPMLEERPIDDGDAPAGDGTRLGPYRLLRVLGRGGMGVVHEARLVGQPTPVALKLLPGFLATQGSSVARFQREGELAARLDHPGIVRVLDAGNAGDTRYLAMEFVTGAPLDLVLQALRGRQAQLLTGQDLSAAVHANLHVPLGETSPITADAFQSSYVGCAVDLAIQLAEALLHAHREGVIHRDVKPSNLLVRADGRLVLTDLGLARETGGSSLTMTGDFAGTLHYVSPEQAMARRVQVDHRTDLFSLGATLYEMLTLQRAFDGDTPQQVLGRILTKEPPAAGRLHPGLPADLVTVLGKLLEKDPDRRYRDAAELIADLRAFLAYRPVAAQRASTFTRVLRWTRREPLRAALLGVLAVAIPSLAGGAGYVWARASEIEAGRAHLKASSVRSLVDQGFLDFALSDDAAAIRRFEAALQLEGTTEAQLGLVLAIMSRDGPEPALSRLEHDLAARMPAGVADLLRFVLKQRLQHADAREVLARVPAPRTDMELYLHAVINRDSGAQTGTGVLEYIERAVLSSSRPQLWIHNHWATYAEAANDAASCRRCAANLQLNWPDSAMANYSAAVALSRVEPERAMQIVQRALAREPDHGLLHCAHGLVLSARGELKEAILAFERAVAAMPGVPRIQYALGKARYEISDHSGAVRAMQAAKELAPRLVDAWTGLGVAQRKIGQLEEAVATLRHAAALHPSNADARFHFGQVLVQKGELQEGLRELQQAARLNAGDPNKWHHVASALFATGDDPGGEAALRRAVVAKPDHERAHSLLVMYLCNRGTRAEARAAMIAWVEAMPQSLSAWLQFGISAVDRSLPAEERDPPAGLWAARRALSISKEQSAMAWLVLGEAQAALGQTAAAITAMERSRASTGMPMRPADRAHCEQRLRELQAEVARGDEKR